MLQGKLYIEIVLALGIVASGIVVWFAMSIHFTILKISNNAKEIVKSYQNYRRSMENQILEAEIESQEKTFEFISKEIHDNILQNISLVVINLNCISVENNITTNSTLKNSTIQLKKVLEDLNNLSKSLDSDLIQTHGFVAACQFECERWNRLYDKTISLNANGEIRHLEKNMELFLFRIIQESLSNAIKYSHASIIQVTISYHIESIEIIIQDNGIGFDLQKILDTKEIGKRSGIKNMKQRAQMISGIFELITSPQKGTKVHVKINLDSYEKNINWLGRRSQTSALRLSNNDKFNWKL